MDFQKAYAILFNAITDAISALIKSNTTPGDISEVIDILKKAQFTTEDMYIEGRK